MPIREEHYLGNPLLKRANIEVELAPDQLLELAKCSDDPIYFAKNYIKIVTLNEGLVNFKPYSFQEEMLENFYTKRFNICKLPRQSGKALSLDTPIPTPNGWTTMGDIKIGDSILDPNGNSVSVIKKTDIMYNHDCYKLYFDNGDSIVADSEHLWEVNSAYWNSKKKIISSKEIFDAYNLKKANKKGFGFAGSYYIEHSKPLNTFIHDVLPIDPYLLGLWLGDGYSDSGRIIAHKNDFYYYKQKIDVEYEREEGNCIKFKCLNLFKKLKNNNLLGNKHIPQIYLRSSYENRLNLLRGLMDTDGSVKKNSRSFEFYQKNYSLILQFVELLSSLGIKSRIRSKRLKGQIYYTVSFTTTEQVFNLQRKCNNVNVNRKTRSQDKRIYIQKIEKINSVPVACLSVDSEDHLFLCGRTFIPTHNSTTTVAFLIHNMLFDEHTSIAILANKAQTAKEILSRLQTAYENLPKWMQQGVKSCNKTSMELENGSKVIAASTSASAVRGGTYSLLMLDEYAFVPEQVANNFMQSVYPTISSGNNSKIIVVSCVTKDTYLLTPKGYRKIENLIQKDKEGAYFVPEYTVRGNNKFYSSNIIVNNKKSQTNIITTRYNSLECSEDHKLWAYSNGSYGYVKSRDLKIGDYIAVKYNQQIFGNNNYVGFLPKKNKNKNTFSCNCINKDIAYFIGLYIAEGYARDIISKKSGNIIGGQIVITCGDNISESLDKLEIKYKKVDDFHYIINSYHLTEFLKTLGFDIKKKAKFKVIPDKVLSWSKENIASLLRGMFDGDGCITNKGKVTYTSTSKELINQVQLLLANLGIIGSVYSAKTKPSKKVKVISQCYSIEITGNYAHKYFEEIGFNLKRKNDRYSLIQNSNRIGHRTDVVPGSAKFILENITTEVENLKLIPKRKKRPFTTFSRKQLLNLKESFYEVSNDIIRTFLDDNVQEDLIWVPIKNIEKSEAEVFDVSLPDCPDDKWCHSVLYNNFLGHQTPKGMNHFYKLWIEAKSGTNDYHPFEIHWSDVPGRDEEWKRQQIANTSQKDFDQEFNTEFLGSSETLISGSKLSNIVTNTPIRRINNLDVYEEPKAGHVYVTLVDTAQGVEKDYSAFVIIDIIKAPYPVVAKYRDNEIKPELYSDIVKKVALQYNQSFLLCEVNEIGREVAKDLIDDEYPNMLLCSTKSRSGQFVGQNFSGKYELGVKMQKNTKKVGCLKLKTLIEENILTINDYDIFSELTTFVQKGSTFEAESGRNDDLVMCLVMFSWLTTNQYFKDIIDIDLRQRLLAEKKDKEEEDVLPFGFAPFSEDVIVDEKTGDMWQVVEDEEMNTLLNLFNYY